MCQNVPFWMVPKSTAHKFVRPWHSHAACVWMQCVDFWWGTAAGWGPGFTGKGRAWNWDFSDMCLANVSESTMKSYDIHDLSPRTGPFTQFHWWFHLRFLPESCVLGRWYNRNNVRKAIENNPQIQVYLQQTIHHLFPSLNINDVYLSLSVPPLAQTSIVWRLFGLIFCFLHFESVSCTNIQNIKRVRASLSLKIWSSKLIFRPTWSSRVFPVQAIKKSSPRSLTPSPTQLHTLQ